MNDKRELIFWGVFLTCTVFYALGVSAGRDSERRRRNEEDFEIALAVARAGGRVSIPRTGDMS